MKNSIEKFKFDLHVHTKETSACGNIIGRDVAKMYKEAGYDGIVITDHYLKEFFDQFPNKSWDKKIDEFLKGFINTKTVAEKIGLKVILGMELRFTDSQNDFLIYGIDEEFLRENKELYLLNIDQFRELIKDKDIMIFQAHPFRAGHYVMNIEALDGIEIFNGNARHDSRNHLASTFAKENDLIGISGSDFHEIEDLSRGGIVLCKMVNSSKELVRQLKNNGIIEIVQS